MKTKDLIAALQEIDPTGEVDVCVDNHDIYFAEALPSYWDGSFQKLIIDESKKPYYSIVGIKIVCTGRKIRLHTMGLQDVIGNDVDAIVSLSEMEGKMSLNSWIEQVATYREETKEINHEIQLNVKSK